MEPEDQISIYEETPRHEFEKKKQEDQNIKEKKRKWKKPRKIKSIKKYFLRKELSSIQCEQLEDKITIQSLEKRDQIEKFLTANENLKDQIQKKQRQASNHQQITQQLYMDNDNKDHLIKQLMEKIQIMALENDNSQKAVDQEISRLRVNLSQSVMERNILRKNAQHMRKNLWKKNEENEKSVVPGKVICKCGVSVNPQNLENHTKTKTHFINLEKIQRSRRPSYTLCDCGTLVNRNNAQIHKLSKTHFKNSGRQQGVHDGTFIQCWCGFFFLDIEKEEHEGSVHHITQMKIIQEGSTQDVENGRVCGICLVSIEGNFYSTQCNHLYHKPCIQKWLQKRSRCPVCRNEIK